MNRWKIPEWLENKVRKRDKKCVYCGMKMLNNIPKSRKKGKLASWEHIINDTSIITQKNIALCCTACNSSKGVKSLKDWLKSEYCKKRHINKSTVANIIKENLN